MVVGRMKFCRDIFRAVHEVDKKWNQHTAVNAYQKAKDSFHPIARRLIEKVRSLELLVQTSIDELKLYIGFGIIELMKEIQ